jgi:Eukaryotic and archaeal DNA primase, large subunit
MDEDRLTPILDHLSKGFVAGIPSELPAEFESSEIIRADQVDYLSKHFPLCMRAMHVNLRKDHHLKHQARLQYGLFLKVLRCQRVINTDYLTSTGDWPPNRRSPCLLEEEFPGIHQSVRWQVRQGIRLQHQTFLWSRGSTTQLHSAKVRFPPLPTYH